MFPSGFLLLSLGNVTALDARDGAVRWRFEAGAAVRTTPAVSAAGVVYVGTVGDTLHALIREHRDAHKVPLNLEHRLMLAMAPDYDHLPLVNKVSNRQVISVKTRIFFFHLPSLPLSLFEPVSGPRRRRVRGDEIYSQPC